MRALLLLLTMTILSCSESPTIPDGIVLDIVTIHQSGQSRVLAPRVEKISSVARLTEVWNEVHGGPTTPAPEVDFTRNEVILAARGETGSSSCESVVIERVTLRSILTVSVAYVSRRAGCPCTLDIGHPVHMVSIPRTQMNLGSRIRSVAIACN